MGEEKTFPFVKSGNCGYIFVREREIEDVEVLAHTLNAGRFWNQHNFTL